MQIFASNTYDLSQQHRISWEMKAKLCQHWKYKGLQVFHGLALIDSAGISAFLCIGRQLDCDATATRGLWSEPKQRQKNPQLEGKSSTLKLPGPPDPYEQECPKTATGFEKANAAVDKTLPFLLRNNVDVMLSMTEKRGWRLRSMLRRTALSKQLANLRKSMGTRWTRAQCRALSRRIAKGLQLHTILIRPP